MIRVGSSGWPDRQLRHIIQADYVATLVPTERIEGVAVLGRVDILADLVGKELLGPACVALDGVL